MESLVECLPDVEPRAPAQIRPQFQQVYDEHFAFCWRMARRLGVPDASVDDVVQDVFLVIHRRLGEYDGRASMRTWLFGILAHVIRDFRRRYRRKDARHVPPAPDSSADVAATSSSTPAVLAERSERVALLKRLLDELDDGKREILVLAYLEQMTVPEIAELLGVNLNTTYSRLRAARQAFDQLHARARETSEKGASR
jgi:RNA polymerase sigma-70 factor (ECF subfamily)